MYKQGWRYVPPGPSMPDIEINNELATLFKRELGNQLEGIMLGGLPSFTATSTYASKPTTLTAEDLEAMYEAMHQRWFVVVEEGRLEAAVKAFEEDGYAVTPTDEGNGYVAAKGFTTLTIYQYEDVPEGKALVWRDELTNLRRRWDQYGA